jgi:hypothetical protein
MDHRMAVMLGGMLVVTVLALIVVSGIAIMAYRKRGAPAE